MMNSLFASLYSQGRTETWLVWTPSSQNAVKINTVGAFDYSKFASFSGMARDSKGQWLGDFTVNLDMCITQRRFMRISRILILHGIKVGVGNVCIELV